MRRTSKMSDNAYFIDFIGKISRVSIPRKHEDGHFSAVRELLGGEGVLVEPISYIESTHGVVYVDEEGMFKHPLDATLTVALDIPARLYGPAVILDTAISEKLKKSLDYFLPQTGLNEPLEEE